MNEIDRVMAWIVAKLKADTLLNNLITGRIYYSGMAPINPVFPYVRYHLQDENDINALSQQRPYVHCKFYVGGVVKLPAATNPLTDITDRIDAPGVLRVRLDPDPSGLLLISGQRIQVLRPVPDPAVSGNTFPEAGFLYDYLVQKAS